MVNHATQLQKGFLYLLETQVNVKSLMSFRLKYFDGLFKPKTNSFQKSHRIRTDDCTTTSNNRYKVEGRFAWSARFVRSCKLETCKLWTFHRTTWSRTLIHLSFAIENQVNIVGFTFWFLHHTSDIVRNSSQYVVCQNLFSLVARS